MEPGDIMQEAEITADAVQKLFKAAFFKSSLDSDGDVAIDTDAGVRVCLSVDTDRKLLKYAAYYRLPEGADEAKLNDALNHANTDYILTRFYSPKSTVLIVDYFLSFDGGLPRYLIVNSLRTFSRIAASGAQSIVDKL